MEIEIKNITVLQVNARPWEVNGKSGIAYRADVVFNGGVATFKTTEEVFNDVKDQKNLECKIGKFKLESYKMDPSIHLVGVEY